jgi:hypothetical protein
MQFIGALIPLADTWYAHFQAALSGTALPKAERTHPKDPAQ